ncbi:hypothetical protein [Streptomyces sp. NRRL S-337]|uniref:hypothetical protein n=1 Tax=Streptomyces sp. NRRL S-337 TaxID=1463900 RepID=UPI00099D9CCA|nr:hypothetical protein [Streptomyces sp. NRRL S-337]
MNLAGFLLSLGATCRITRFITKDKLAAGFRIWMADRFGDESKVTYLINCCWCTSTWVGASVAAFAQRWEDSSWFHLTTTALCLSYAAGVASRWLD